MTRQNLLPSRPLGRAGAAEHVGFPFDGHVRRPAKVEAPDSPASPGSGGDPPWPGGCLAQSWGHASAPSGGSLHTFQGAHRHQESGRTEAGCPPADSTGRELCKRGGLVWQVGIALCSPAQGHASLLKGCPLGSYRDTGECGIGVHLAFVFGYLWDHTCHRDPRQSPVWPIWGGGVFLPHLTERKGTGQGNSLVLSPRYPLLP